MRPLRPHVVRGLPIVGLGLPSNGGRRHTWTLAAFPLWSASLRRTRKRPKLVTLGLAKLISEVGFEKETSWKRKGGKEIFGSEVRIDIINFNVGTFFHFVFLVPPLHV